MAIERTAQNLATFCLQVVGTAYWFGTFGQKASRQLYNEKKAQYPIYYPPKSWTEASFVDDFGKRVTDCAGLIKWFLWSDNMTNKNPTYKGSEDWGANTMWNNCKERGKMSSYPGNIPGMLVFKGTDDKKNHVGVVVDTSGTVVEAKGHAYGTIKSKASEWGYWGKFNLIKYDVTPTPQPTPTPEPTPTPTPTDNKYAVTGIKTFLAIRSTPEARADNKNKVGELTVNGTVLEVLEQKDGWGRISGDCWVSMKYLKKV